MLFRSAVVTVPASSELGKRPRKPRAPKERPPGMSNRDWIVQSTRLRKENAQRRSRESAQRQRELMAKMMAEEQAVAEEEEAEEEEAALD